MNADREDTLRRVMQESGESTKAGAIDVAMKHYLNDLRNKKRVVDELPPSLATELSTAWIPIDSDPSVGLGGD
jgi:hypothetical protein